MEDFWTELLYGGSLTLLFIGIMVVSKFINDLVTPYKVDDELTQKDNPALAVSIAGYFIGSLIIYAGAFMGPSKGIIGDLAAVGGYSALGIVLLNISRIINDKCILYRFSNYKEIIEDRNIGIGAVQFGSYVASALIIAGAIHGEGGGIVSVFVFYALGQAALILAGFLYNLITPYNIHDEMEKDNAAAGIAFSGSLIAVGIVLMRGASGNFISWSSNLAVFGLDALIIFILFPLFRIIFDKVLLPGGAIDDEISKDRNTGAGFLEASVLISVAVALMLNLG